MTCFDEEPDHEMEEWIKSGGKCVFCGELSEYPICNECMEEKSDG